MITLIMVGIVTVGSLLALFGFVGPLTRDIMVVLPFVVYAGCVSFVLLIAWKILQTILGASQNRGQQYRGQDEQPEKIKYRIVKKADKIAPKGIEKKQVKQLNESRKKSKKTKK